MPRLNDPGYAAPLTEPNLPHFSKQHCHGCMGKEGFNSWLMFSLLMHIRHLLNVIMSLISVHKIMENMLVLWSRWNNSCRYYKNVKVCSECKQWSLEKDMQYECAVTVCCCLECSMPCNRVEIIIPAIPIMDSGVYIAKNVLFQWHWFQKYPSINIEFENMTHSQFIQ